MNITVYYVVEKVGDDYRYYSGPHPAYPQASLSRREAVYASLAGEDRYYIVENTMEVELVS